ncbi:hypothetical protein ACB092_06G080000 [Castanea dentata]
MSNCSSFFFFYLFAFHNLGAVVGQSTGFVGDELNTSSRCFKKIMICVNCPKSPSFQNIWFAMPIFFVIISQELVTYF